MTIEKQHALEVREHALQAIIELNKTLNAAHGKCSDADYDRIKRAVGMSIGRIQTEILDVMSATHPELDNLRHVK